MNKVNILTREDVLGLPFSLQDWVDLNLGRQRRLGYLTQAVRVRTDRMKVCAFVEDNKKGFWEWFLLTEETGGRLIVGERLYESSKFPIKSPNSLISAQREALEALWLTELCRQPETLDEIREADLCYSERLVMREKTLEVNALRVARAQGCILPPRQAVLWVQQKQR
jgi:hypothetical protein